MSLYALQRRASMRAYQCPRFPAMVEEGMGKVMQCYGGFLVTTRVYCTERGKS
jgi:hypothetical protein